MERLLELFSDWRRQYGDPLAAVLHFQDSVWTDPQTLSNFLAFCLAASFSFYVNAVFTFAMPASLPRYALFMLCMGALSLGVGALADRWNAPGIVTVMVFSLVSLVCGFLLSRWVVFRERDR